MGAGRRVLLVAIAASLTATALLAIGILLFGDFGQTEGRILATTALLAGYGLLALPAGFLVDRARLPALAASVLVLAAGGFALAVASVWTSEPPAALDKTVVTVTAFAVASTQTAALAARRRARDPGSVRRLFALSVVLVLVVAGMAAAGAWAEIDRDAYFRILASVAVLDVLAVALQPILALARPEAAVYRLRILVEPAEEIEKTIEAADFATAAARAIRAVERNGRRVVGVSRTGGPR